MDNTMIAELIGKILAAFVVGILAYLAPRIKDWLTSHTDKATEESILTMARSFAQAAEQLLKQDDPTGTKRLEYVVDHLQSLGIAVTSSVLAMIEGVVWEINLNNEVSTDEAD